MPVRINIHSVANSKKARKEQRNGRDVYVIPSATLPDDVIMNKIKYPASEIENSYRSLERTPAPLGHPTAANGRFLSARDPEGINANWIGAWNENVRREGGRVLLDKVIDIAVANQTDGGKRVLSAINDGKPIHTSTGLYCELETVKNASDHEHVARSIDFDHDAILLDVSGAATPEQGVGMFVNSAGAEEEIQVINSFLEMAENDLEWSLKGVKRAIEDMESTSVLERAKAALLEAFGFKRSEPSTNEKESEMSKEVLDKLDAMQTAFAEGLSKIGTDVGAAVANALKPVLDAQTAAANEAKAREEAEKDGLVKKVVEANQLSEAAAKATPVEVLRELANKEKSPEQKKSAMNLNNSMGSDKGDGKSPYGVPAARKA